jgi:hypothetical protein
MPKGVYDRKEKNQMANETAAPVQPSEKLFPVKLLKNYRPAGSYEVVGYHQPEITQKDSAGRVVVVQKAEFIEGHAAPPPYSGVGFDTKIWSDTVLKLPVDEAKNLVAKKIAERADAIAA